MSVVSSNLAMTANTWDEAYSFIITTLLSFKDQGLTPTQLRISRYADYSTDPTYTKPESEMPHEYEASVSGERNA